MTEVPYLFVIWTSFNPCRKLPGNMNIALTVALTALIAYYALAILLKGRQGDDEAVVVQYEPPAGVSPAVARFLWCGSVDQRSIACVLASLAMKRRISLNRHNGSYEIAKLPVSPPADELTAEERLMMDWLFSNFLDRTIFDPRRSAQGCIMSLRGSLQRTLREEYAHSHAGYIALGMTASLCALLAIAHSAGAPMVLVTALYFTSLMAALVIELALVPALHDFVRAMGSIGRVTFSVALSAFVAAGATGVIIQLQRAGFVSLGIVTCIAACVNIAAVPLLRAPTKKGVVVRRQLQGFREYLLKVEQDSLDRMIRPNTIPPATAEMLGYAIALEVKEAWGDDLTNACYAGQG